MSYRELFRMPKPVTITARSSSITNAFINGIIPCIEPTEEEIETALKFLGMDKDTIRCAYCGGAHTEWDHFRPLVKNKRATGYISEIHNLVPSCSKCNQSKGNKEWKTWIRGNAKHSPQARNIENLQEIIMRLEAFETWGDHVHTKLDFEKIVGKEKWENHWKNCEELHEKMREYQILSDEIKQTVQSAILSNRQEGSGLNDPDITTLKVGKIANLKLRSFLQKDSYPIVLVEYLQQAEYCKDTFKVRLPVLLEIEDNLNLSSKGRDVHGNRRYYKDPLHIQGKYYLLMSQWTASSKPYLLEWLQKNSGQY